MTSPLNPVAGEFAIEQTWAAIAALLDAQLPDVDVDSIGERDFDEQGDLTINPPAVRVCFLEENPGTPVETQNATYNDEQLFAIICADEDLSSSTQQRLASLRLATTVKRILVGGRLWLADGTQTEPLIFAGTRPLSTAGLGMAYVVGITVPNIAQFSAPNAIATQEAF